MALPFDPEPDAIASDSAGIARLARIAMVWQTVRLFHPSVAANFDGWDGTLVRSLPGIRAAKNPEQLAAAVTSLLGVLRDPYTRVEREDGARAAAAVPVPVRATVRSDSTMVLELPTTGPYRAADSVELVRAGTLGAARAILDLRSPRTGDVDAVNALVERSGFVESLIATSLMVPGQRVRRVGVLPSAPSSFLSAIQIAAPFADAVSGILVQDGARLQAAGSRAPRIVVIANANTVFPGAVAALLLSGRASLVADGSTNDESLVTSVRIPIAPGIVVRIRTSVLAYGDTIVGLSADTVTARGEGPDAPSMRTALALVRSARQPRIAHMRPLPMLSFPIGTMELANDTTPYPYLGARLLAGFRVWSVMRTQHAHRESYDDDIDAVFERTIPRLEAARNRQQYATALSDLVASFDDSQVLLRGASREALFGPAVSPFRARLVEGRVIVTSSGSSLEAGAPPVGAELTMIDGFPTTAWLSEHRRSVAASNEWTRGRDLLRLMARGPAGAAIFRIRDATGPERALQVSRRPTAIFGMAAHVPERVRPFVARLGNDIAYLDLDRMDTDRADSALAGVANARAVVLDLRGTLNVTPDIILRRFATVPEFIAARIVRRAASAPCTAPLLRDAQRTCIDERSTTPVVLHTDTTGHYRGRLAVLIDERTQGEEEQLALALEAGANATLIGSSSAGAAATPVTMSLPGGLALQFPVDELRRADGGQLHRVGLTPVVEVRPTVRGVRAGQDEVLDRAQQWLQAQLDGPRRRR